MNRRQAGMHTRMSRSRFQRWGILLGGKSRVLKAFPWSVPCCVTSATTIGRYLESRFTTVMICATIITSMAQSEASQTSLVCHDSKIHVPRTRQREVLCLAEKKEFCFCSKILTAGLKRAASECFTSTLEPPPKLAGNHESCHARQPEK